MSSHLYWLTIIDLFVTIRYCTTNPFSLFSTFYCVGYHTSPGTLLYYTYTHNYGSEENSRTKKQVMVMDGGEENCLTLLMTRTERLLAGFIERREAVFLYIS